jgi:hypothetical protein
MYCWPQPRGIVKRSRTHAVRAIIPASHAANPAATLRADPTYLRASAVSRALDLSWLNPHEAEGGVGNDDRHRERATGQALAIDTVACVDRSWRFGDLIANLAAQAAASLWKFHTDQLSHYFHSG